ncbi:MAG: ribosome maturation factor RimP [Lachnospiraceae bacterium]|nr:ribosome maturation factor RimP [Lachnospiraceae bacterium]
MGKHEDYERKTGELIAPILKDAGVELYDIDFEKEGADWYLRVYIDKEGGVNINDCEKVSRAFNEILDKEDYIEESYIFEVSSPGLGRRLTKNVHFEKSLGLSVDVKTFKPIDKCKEFTGILKAYDQNTVTVTVDDKDMEFNRKDIANIRLSLDI